MRQSHLTDSQVKLFYEFYAQTVVGGEWMCVVVKYPPMDAQGNVIDFSILGVSQFRKDKPLEADLTAA